MQVERGFEAAFVQGGNETGRVGEEVAVPGVARPATGGIAGVGEVPIHVDNAHGKRHIVGLELVHQAEQFVGGIGPITAPPVAQRPARNHRRGASHLRKLLQTGVNILPVAKKIEVEVAIRCVTRFQPAIGVKNEARRIVVDGVAAAGEQAFFQHQRAIDIIQGAGGAKQIEGIIFAKVPGCAAFFEGDGEGFRSESGGVGCVVELEMGGGEGITAH